MSPSTQSGLFKLTPSHMEPKGITWESFSLEISGSTCAHNFFISYFRGNRFVIFTYVLWWRFLNSLFLWSWVSILFSFITNFFLFFKINFLLEYSWFKCCVSFCCTQSESVIHWHISTLFLDSYIGQHRVLTRVPCATHWVLINFLFSSVYISVPVTQFTPPCSGLI